MGSKPDYIGNIRVALWINKDEGTIGINIGGLNIKLDPNKDKQPEVKEEKIA